MPERRLVQFKRTVYTVVGLQFDLADASLDSLNNLFASGVQNFKLDSVIIIANTYFRAMAADGVAVLNDGEVFFTVK